MKKLAVLSMSMFMILGLAACGNQGSGNGGGNGQAGSFALASMQESSAGQSSENLSDASEESGVGVSRESVTDASQGTMGASSEAAEDSSESSAETPAEDTAAEPEIGEGKVLVVYYSATGSTRAVAEYIGAATQADLFELVPTEPYSSADLDWTDDNSRVVSEHNNPDARAVELEAATVADWESYDTVFVGYPIWWGIAAWPVDGFVTANDFTGKTVIPFCTSSSSGLGESGELLAEAAGTGNWLEGQRFSSSVSEETVLAWVEELESLHGGSRDDGYTADSRNLQ